MKIHRIIAAALALMILTACDTNTDDEEKYTEKTETVTEETDYFAETAFSEISGELVFELATAEEIPAESGDGSSSEETEWERLAQSSGFRTLDLSGFAEEESYFHGYITCGDKNICAGYTYPDNRSDYILIINTDTYEIINKIEMPENDWRCTDIVINSDNSNIAAYAELFKGSENITSLVSIYDDGNFDIDRNAGLADAQYICGEHRLSNSAEGSIVDKDTGMSIVHEIIEVGNTFIQSNRFLFPIDDNRFVYKTDRTNNGEKSVSFGIYDFETGTEREIYEPDNIIPLFAKDGKIYSGSAPKVGGGELFITDTETLETDILCKAPFDIGSFRRFINYCASPSGQYIGAYFGGSYNSTNADEFAFVAPWNGDIIRNIYVPPELNFEGGICTDSRVYFKVLNEPVICILDLPRSGFALKETESSLDFVYSYAGETEVIRSYDPYSDPVPTITEFTDIMGKDGVWLIEGSDDRSEHFYFAADKGDPVCIAEGVGAIDYRTADIDGDGITDLICSNGEDTMLIYIRGENGVIRAEWNESSDIDPEKLDFSAYHSPFDGMSIVETENTRKVVYTESGKSTAIRIYDKVKTWEGYPVISEFTDIMGCDGYIIEDMILYGSGRTYVGIINGDPVKIGNSFGFTGHEDYSVDIDGDGITELICNCTYTGDGVEEAFIFKMTGSGVMQASGRDLLDIEVKLFGASRMAVRYSPEKEKMIILCIPEGQENAEEIEYDIDPEKLNFTEYSPLN